MYVAHMQIDRRNGVCRIHTRRPVLLRAVVIVELDISLQVAEYCTYPEMQSECDALLGF